MTETMKVLEELSVNLSLSETVSGFNTYGVRGIERFGTAQVLEIFFFNLIFLLTLLRFHTQAKKQFLPPLYR